MVRIRGFLLVASRAKGLASILRAMLSGVNSSSGIGPMIPRWLRVGIRNTGRSEEHTSELQSRENLVCRLLLEKKKKNRPKIQRTTLQRYNSLRNYAIMSPQ